jgi:hypothetical protein
MIAVTSLQLRAGEPLFREDASKRAAGLPISAKWRQDPKEEDWDEQFLHTTVLEQRVRFVDN